MLLEIFIKTFCCFRWTFGTLFYMLTCRRRPLSFLCHELWPTPRVCLSCLPKTSDTRNKNKLLNNTKRRRDQQKKETDRRGKAHPKQSQRKNSLWSHFGVTRRLHNQSGQPQAPLRLHRKDYTTRDQCVADVGRTMSFEELAGANYHHHGSRRVWRKALVCAVASPISPEKLEKPR